jgi:hypothetical protein
MIPGILLPAESDIKPGIMALVFIVRGHQAFLVEDKWGSLFGCGANLGTDINTSSIRLSSGM